MTDVDGLGPIDYMASGRRQSHVHLPFAKSSLVPAWGADTWDGYDIYAGNWPLNPAQIPACPIGAHKAGEGHGTFDVRFPAWVRDVAPRHRYRMAYHVIWPWRPGKASNYIEQQADDFLTYTTNNGFRWDEDGYGGQIDNELFTGMPRVANNDEVARFDAYVTERVGPRLLHYCNPVTDPVLFFDDSLCGGRKWEAQYNRNPSRAMTVIRQFGGFPVPGIAAPAPDANHIEQPDILDAALGYTTDPQENDMLDPVDKEWLIKELVPAIVNGTVPGVVNPVTGDVINAIVANTPTADQIAAAVVAKLPASSGSGPSLDEITAAFKDVVNHTALRTP